MGPTLFHTSTNQQSELTPVTIWSTPYLYHSLLLYYLVNVTLPHGRFAFCEFWQVAYQKLLKTKILYCLVAKLRCPFLESFLVVKPLSFKQFSRKAPAFNNIKKEKLLNLKLKEIECIHHFLLVYHVLLRITSFLSGSWLSRHINFVILWLNVFTCLFFVFTGSRSDRDEIFEKCKLQLCHVA